MCIRDRVTAELEAVTGLTRQDDLTINDSEFEVEATRELTDADVAHIHTILDRASGEEGGEGWIRREANGLPTVTISLPDGGYARVTPKIAPVEGGLNADDINALANSIEALNELGAE